MTTRILLQPSFVLHSRPFRDTSLIVELFSFGQGRISVLARGVRSRRSKAKGLLLPFYPLLVSWSGKGDLPTISKFEAAGLPYELSGRSLLSGLYLNELIVKTLHRHDPHPQLYRAYQKALAELQRPVNLEAALRYFEKSLLQELGYGLRLQQDAEGSPIVAEQNYRYVPEHGFVVAKGGSSELFSGAMLLALHREQLASSVELLAAKRLMRRALPGLLGDHVLKSRELF